MSAEDKTKLDGIEAGAQVQPADLAELDSVAATKLAGIEAGAEVQPTGAEMQTAILALTDADRVLIGSEPESSEYKIYGVHRNAAGILEYVHESVARP